MYVLALFDTLFVSLCTRFMVRLYMHVFCSLVCGVQPSVRVEREEAPEGALTFVRQPATRESFSSSDSSETESLMSAGQPQTRSAGLVFPSASQPPSLSPHQQDHQAATHPTAIRLSADQLLLPAQRVPPSSELHNSLEQRIQQLTSCIEKMSAKMVLLETQIHINEQQRGGKLQDQPSQQVSTHESACNVLATASTEADRVGATLSSVGSTHNDGVTGMEGGRSGTEDITRVASERAVTQRHTRADVSDETSRQWVEKEAALTPHLALVSKPPMDGLNNVHMDTQTHKETSAGMVRTLVCVCVFVQACFCGIEDRHLAMY